MKNDNRWIEIIKKEVENQINQEYTEYKDKKIQDLDTELERKRNSIVKDILNSITILSQQEPCGVNIMIKVENRIIQK